MSAPALHTESVAADQWIYNRLSADAELVALVGGRIRNERPRDDDAFPVVVFQALSPGVDVLARTTRVMTDMVYQVKVISRVSSYVPLDPIVARIDAALHEQSGSVPGLIVVGCWREGVIRYPEIADGVEYRHYGGRFRLLVHPA